MTEPSPGSADQYLQRITLALTELAKGMKSVSFYPPDHPILIRNLSKIILLFEEIPLPEEGLEIGISKNSLLYKDNPLPGGTSGKALVDLNRELYLRRAARIIFLPNMKPEEVVSFLQVVLLDVEKVLDAGGLENALMERKVTRIWANRVDYDKMTEILKEEEELQELEPEDLPENLTEEMLEGSTVITALREEDPETLPIEDLIARIDRETDPSAYRGHIVEFSRLLIDEPHEKKLEYATLAISIFVRHI